MKPMVVCLSETSSLTTYISKKELQTLLEQAYEAGKNDTLIKYGLVPLDISPQCEKCRAEIAHLIKHHNA